MNLTPAQRDRIAGVLLGTAAGDALGAGYEFGPPLASDIQVTMTGGGSFGWEPGEWTDDTSMAIPIARAIAAGHDLRDESVLDGIVAAWVDWAKTAPDVGIQLGAILRSTKPAAAAIRVVAQLHHERTGRSAGNGSLMRTAPVALAYLDDPSSLAEVARSLSSLTHYEEDAGDACVLWCLAIRHAVLTGEADVRIGLTALAADRSALWLARIEAAESKQPRDFNQNGWVVEALQGAWSAIFHSISDGAYRLQEGLERAVRGGRDTDTVAAIAGGLLGATWGASAVPARWRRIIHGWPGLTATDLTKLGLQAANGGAPGWPAVEKFDYSGWGDVSALVRHPHDDGVWLGGVGALAHLPADVDAVVSLCRVGTAEVPVDIALEVWLIDSNNPADNPNLAFVIDDTADAIAALRAEGHVVLVHCVQAISRTPTVAAAYSVRHLGVPVERAKSEVRAALPHARPAAALDAVV